MMRTFFVLKRIYVVGILCTMLLFFTGCAKNSGISDGNPEQLADQNKSVGESHAPQATEKAPEEPKAFHPTIKVSGHVNSLIYYLYNRVEKEEAQMIVTFDTQTGKPLSAELIVPDYYNIEHAKDSVNRLQQNDETASKIFNERIEESTDGTYTLYADVDLKAPFDQYIGLYIFDGGQRLHMIKEHYTQVKAQQPHLPDYEEGENFMYCPLSRLRFEW